MSHPLLILVVSLMFSKYWVLQLFVVGKSFTELAQELLQESLIGFGALYLKEEEPGGFVPMLSGDLIFH